MFYCSCKVVENKYKISMAVVNYRSKVALLFKTSKIFIMFKNQVGRHRRCKLLPTLQQLLGEPRRRSLRKLAKRAIEVHN